MAIFSELIILLLMLCISPPPVDKWPVPYFQLQTYGVVLLPPMHASGRG